MKVFLACQQSPHIYPIPAYGFWRTYFRAGLREGGCEVCEVDGVDWAKGLLPLSSEERARWREEAWSRTLAAVGQARAQDPRVVLLGYFYPEQIEPGALSALRDLGVPTVNFFCDNVRLFRTVPAAYRGFDVHWVPEFDALEMYRRAGLPHVHAPMPAWVAPEHRTCEHRERWGPTFIGTYDRVRSDLLATAIERGAELTVRGRGWARTSHETLPAPRRAPFRQTIAGQAQFIRDQGIMAFLRRHAGRPRARPVPARHVGPEVEDYVAATQQSSVIVGINRYPSFRHPYSRPPTYSRLRDIEAPMLGACYLTEYAPGIEQLYNLGTEIEVYRDAFELADKVRALQADPAQRRSLRRAGQRRALSHHTVARSFDRILRELGADRRPSRGGTRGTT